MKDMERENNASRLFTGNLFYRLMAPAMAAVMESPLRRRVNDANRVLDGAGVLPGTQVLEVGCGTGYFTLPAARRICEMGHLRAIDLSTQAIDLVYRKVGVAGLRNVSLGTADAKATGLPGTTYDMILLFGMIPAPMLPLSLLLPEMHRVLKPDGVLAVWPNVPLWTRKAFTKSGLFSFEGKANGVLRFRKIDNKPGPQVMT
jgi:demethylmenaquinone methyltransferase/2-methoxy-6-polyprenyl-1,4-benzoquinol methylase